jgi:hypothetical protein
MAAAPSEAAIQEELNAEYLLERVRTYIDQQVEVRVQATLEAAVSDNHTDLKDRIDAINSRVNEDIAAMRDVNNNYGGRISDLEGSREFLHDAMRVAKTKNMESVPETDETSSTLTTHMATMCGQMRHMQAEIGKMRMELSIIQGWAANAQNSTN